MVTDSTPQRNVEQAVPRGEKLKVWGWKANIIVKQKKKKERKKSGLS